MSGGDVEGVSAVRVRDLDLERVGPRAGPGGLQDEAVDVDLCGRGDDAGHRVVGVRAVHHPHRERGTAAVAEEVAHRVPETAQQPQAAEGPLKVAEARQGIGSSTGPLLAWPMNAVMDVATPVIVRLPLGISWMYTPG